ncbi:MAG: PEP-CTERM sorting domain-containing protein [Verrucomicrobia bacterium]|jgi:hypothetical protein|nr:PEP-CTERM sorting domain-containing protein [Verrucomicrobiota bacterium]
MKTKLKSFAVAGWLLSATLQLHAQGYIVPNGVVYAGLHSGGYEIDVVHDPTNGYSTGFFLDPLSKTPPASPYTNTFLFDYILDVGVRVFLVSLNDPVSLQPILANSYTELLGLNSYVFDSGSAFYVGLYTGNQNYHPPDGIYSDPLFGWAKLMNNNGAIQLLNSALAYKAEGIYAGTQNFVPEPSAFVLIVLGAACLLMFRRRSMFL